MRYLTPKEVAEQWGVSQRRVHTLCATGRIEGAERHGWTWLIPEVAEKPEDKRVRSGRYIRQRESERADVNAMPYTLMAGAIIHRSRLVELMAPPGVQLTYIHAGAGCGKTTLLLQYAQGRTNCVWLPLDERDSDASCFLRHLETAFREKLGRIDFSAIDYIPLIHSKVFSSSVLSALLKAIGQNRISVLMDDVHTVDGGPVADLLNRWVIACPANITLIMASRRELWSSLFPLKLAGGIAEFTKDDLRFSREEAEDLWGFFDEELYAATEGWTLAVQSYRLAAEGGALPADRIHAERGIFRYLFDEIFERLPAETQHFLSATAWMNVLEPVQCDELLGIANARDVLESLSGQNIFTLRAAGGTYRYHALLRAFLLQNNPALSQETLSRAMEKSFTGGDWGQAAEYALLLGDCGRIQDCIGAILQETSSWGRIMGLKKYFDFLEAQGAELTSHVMIAKGILLSDQGRFVQAEELLSAAIPRLDGEDKNLYYFVMAHMARVLRNRVSFTESTRCIDLLLPLPKDIPAQALYGVMIEKIHNLTLLSRLVEALDLTKKMMERCLEAGMPGVKAWFERYLVVIYFYMGDYKNCIHVYEKTKAIPREEQEWLMRHSVGGYAAKAYQMTGQEADAIPLLEAELAGLKQLGLYEEYSMNYLLYAETLHSAELLKRYNGLPFDFSETERYLALAEEYAVLNRSTRVHALFVKIWRLCSRLVEQPERAEAFIAKTLKLLKNATPFFQTLAYGRMANALDMLSLDAVRCKEFLNRSIQVGEKIGSYAYAAYANGRLASICLQEGDRETAAVYARSFLELSYKYWNRYYVRFRPLFGSVLTLALECGIMPEYTRELMSYGGYAAKRVFVHTLGNLYIAPEYTRESRTRIRTQKARELLAYLLAHQEGVTKEQIFEDLWQESEADTGRLFHTRRGEIRKAFENLGAKNPILHEKGVYRLNMEEILCDYDEFWRAVNTFREQSTPENADWVADLYTGRYLDDLEALWAEGARLRCEDVFLEAAEVLLKSYRIAGERAKEMELLRRCTHLGYPDRQRDV